MKPYGLNELRKMYLEFFEGKEHLVMPSFSLVPQNGAAEAILHWTGDSPQTPRRHLSEVYPYRRY